MDAERRATMTTIRAADLPRLSLPWLALLALPMVGLAVLIARPQLDLEWRHQPSHFWLVLIVAVVSLALAYLTNEAAMRRGDARLFLISLAFGVSAGFLGLHALATPGVLLPSPNLGFVIATPVGLTIAAALAAIAALPLGGPRGDLVLRHAGVLRGAVVAVLVVVGSRVDPRGPGTHGAGRTGRGRATAPARRRSWRSPCTRSPRGTSCGCWPGAVDRSCSPVVVALILLAEAMVTVVFSRDWHLSWWEWHLLMAIAFGAVAFAARIEYRREGSLTGAFGGLYLSGTLERLHRWHAEALSDLASAQAEGRLDRPHPRSPPRRRRDDRRARPPRARRGRSCAASTSSSGRTCPGSSRIGRGPIRPRLASGAARSAT